MTPRRLTREERKAKTRDDLVRSAIRVFARRGFHGASVDDVAADAGYSTGAVYSNFGGKEDLFLAGFEHEIARHVGEVAAAVAAAQTPEERTRAVARQWMDFLQGDPDRFLLFLEYLAYSLRNRRLRPQFKERFGAFREATARMLADQEAEAGRALPLPAEQIAVVANALTYGMAIEHFAEPDGVPDELFGDALGLLFETRSSSAEGRG